MEKSITTQALIYEAKKEENINLELPVPEYLPGISKIINTSVLFSSCELHTESTKAQLETNAHFDVLYLSDFGGKIKCASFDKQFSIPFKEPFEKDTDLTAVPSVHISALSAKPISSRKILLKGTLYASCQAYSDRETPIFVSDNDEEDICVLEKKIVCCDTVIIQSSSMTATAELNLEKDSPAANEVLLPKAAVHSPECVCNDGKLTVNAKLCLYALYECLPDEVNADSSATYACVNSQTDFQCIVEDARIKENCDCLAFIDINAIDCNCSYDSYGDSRIINYTISYTLCAKLFENKEYTVTQDVFSTAFPLQVENRKTSFNVSGESFSLTRTLTESLHGDLSSLSEISCCFAHIKTVSTENSSGKTFANVKCLIEVIGINSQGSISCVSLPASFHIPFDEKVNSYDSLEYFITVISCNASLRDGSIDVSVDFDIKGIFKNNLITNAVCSITKDIENPISRAKGQLTVYYPSKDDTLWSVSKKYFVKPSVIRSSNGIDEDTDTLDGIVIIP